MKDEIPIHYLRRYEIDAQKWDNCITEASNGLIYARAFYLDHMAVQWDALVMGNYEAVMPLATNRKWKISYLYQPPFVQQLGIFSRHDMYNGQTSRFISLIKTRFDFAEINLNYRNAIREAENRHNYILDLNPSYQQICANYKDDLIKNLKKAKKYNLTYGESDDFPKVIQSFRQAYGERFTHVRRKDYLNFRILCDHAYEKKMVLVREVFSAEQEVLAMSLILKDERRLYNIMSTTTEKGRRYGANHFLFEELIKEFAGTSTILDFEGSDIPGIAKFYQKFGSINEPYFFIRYNNLPKPLKWFKR